MPRSPSKPGTSGKHFFEGDGTAEPFKMTNCTYWNIVGLHAESGDFMNEAAPREPRNRRHVFEIVGSTDLGSPGI